MNLQILRKIGLSDGELNIYASLLSLNVASTNQIHEKTGMERRNIYDILNKLIGKGLVAYINENKKRLFCITHPNKIIGYIEEKEYNLEKIKEEVKELMPSLIESFEVKKPQIKAEVYRGSEGIKAVWEEMLNYKENYFIGGGLYVAKKLPYFWENYNKRRIKAGVKWYNLGRAELKGSPLVKARLMSTKFLPEEFSGNPAVIFIYGNKVAQVLWSEDFFAFVVENKEIAENHLRYFRYLWKNVAYP